MTNQQPDKFFREKLADYHKPAPAGAWDKIESSLKKTKLNSHGGKWLPHSCCLQQLRMYFGFKLQAQIHSRYLRHDLKLNHRVQIY